MSPKMYWFKLLQGSFVGHFFSWKQRKILAEVGPNEDPIDTPSFCFWSDFLKMKYAPFIDELSMFL